MSVAGALASWYPGTKNESEKWKVPNRAWNDAWVFKVEKLSSTGEGRDEEEKYFPSLNEIKEFRWGGWGREFVGWSTLYTYSIKCK